MEPAEVQIAKRFMFIVKEIFRLGTEEMMWPEAILQIKSTNSGSPQVRYSPAEDGNAGSIDYISVIVQLLLVFNFSVHTK